MPWSVIVPVKGGPAAKSRLAASLPALGRSQVSALAEAMLTDTLEAVSQVRPSAQLVVVGGDLAIVALTQRLGGRWMPDPGGGLNAAISAAGRTIATQPQVAGLDLDWPRLDPVAVLLGDLPAMRSLDLRAALDAASEVFSAGKRCALLADAEGTGTVLLAGRTAGDLLPRFGAGSRRAHREAGAWDLTPDATSVPLDPYARIRQDVDTEADLRAALTLGCGPRTTAVVRGWDGVPSLREEAAGRG